MPILFEFFNIFRKQSATAIETNPTSQYKGSENDKTFYPGNNMSGIYHNQYDYDRQTIFSECLRASRVNPIARRIVKLISIFVVGSGIEVISDNKHSDKYLQDWWRHPLNQLDHKSVNFCDEATRSGNLFFLCTAD
ncbi:MAG: hypothetical protein ABSA01_08180 [Anaerolineales bacterium]|jgi:hypothetical protein